MRCDGMGWDEMRCDAMPEDELSNRHDIAVPSVAICNCQ